MNPAKLAWRTVYSAVDYVPAIGILTITAKAIMKHQPTISATDSEISGRITADGLHFR